MNIKTQSIKRFKRNFGNWSVGPLEHSHKFKEFPFWIDVEQFLSQTIDEVREETLKEVLMQVEQMALGKTKESLGDWLDNKLNELKNK